MKTTSILLISLFLTTFLYGNDPVLPMDKGEKWGTSYESFIKNSKPGVKSQKFNPGTRPDYSNRILDHLAGLNENIIKDSQVVKFQNEPEKEYIFIKNRLSIISIAWNTMDKIEQQKLFDILSRKFGQPDKKKELKAMVYSFSDNTTKILFFSTDISGDTCSCQVHFYPRNLFKILIVE